MVAFKAYSERDLAALWDLGAAGADPAR
jgi:hypothetical protein